MVLERSLWVGRCLIVSFCGVVAACGSSPSSVNNPSTTLSSDLDEGQGWRSGLALIEPPVGEEPDVGSAVRPSISSIVWTPEGYRAAGVAGAGVTIWTSPDGLVWEVVEPNVPWCCSSPPRSIELVVAGEALLAVVTGNELSTGEIVSLLWSSSDGGSLWERHEGAPWGVAGNTVDLVVSGESVTLATSTIEGPSGPITTLWRSVGLDSWTVVDLESQPATGWVTPVIADDGSSLITATSNDLLVGALSLKAGRLSYLGTGETFTRVSEELGSAILPLGAIGGRFVAQVDPYRTGSDTVEDDPVVATTTDGITWEVSERSTGVWGDGRVRLSSLSTTTEGPGYLVVDRILRADDRYCFDDVASCQQRQTVLLTTTDGLNYEVVDVELEGRGVIVVGDNGSLLFWSAPFHRFESSSSDLLIQVWSGPQPPPAYPVEPLTPPTDDSPVVIDFSATAPGETFRARLPIGACTNDRLRIADRWFVNADPPAQPVPADWPFKAEEADDGPAGYLFVTGHRPDNDTFIFKVTPTTTLEYAFDPNGAPDLLCG